MISVKPCEWWDNLPTSTDEFTVFLNHQFSIVSHCFPTIFTMIFPGGHHSTWLCTTALHRFAQNFDTLSDADALPMFLGSGTSEDG